MVLCEYTVDVSMGPGVEFYRSKGLILVSKSYEYALFRPELCLFNATRLAPTRTSFHADFDPEVVSTRRNNLLS